MPLTTRGLEYTNASTFEELFRNTDLELCFDNNAAIDEVNGLFQTLQAIKITSLEITYVYNQTYPATQTDSSVFRQLAALIDAQGANLRCFKLILDLTFEENDLFEETLLTNLKTLVPSASQLIQLNQCSLIVQSRQEVGSCDLFDTLVSFLCQTPKPHLLNDLALNFENVNTTEDDDEVSTHAKLIDFAKKCDNLRHVETNFSNWCFGLYNLLLLLKKPHLKTVNVKLNGPFFEAASSADAEEGMLLEKQIPFLAQILQSHLSLTEFTLDINLADWIAANPERGWMLQNMLELASKNPAIRQLSINFGETLKFNSAAAQSILSLFNENLQVTKLMLPNLDASEATACHNIATRNQVHLDSLLSTKFDSHDLPTEIFTRGNVPIYFIGPWLEPDCKAHDILLYFYFINLSYNERSKHQYYLIFMLAAAVSQFMPASSCLPYNTQASIAEYLDKPTMKVLLETSGGFFTKLKRELPALKAIYEARCENSTTIHPL